MMIAAGRMGWTESEFNFSTPVYFFRAYEGFVQNEQSAWHIARYLGAITLQPHAKKGSRITPLSLGRFPWEKREGSSAVANKELLKKAWAEMLAEAAKNPN